MESITTPEELQIKLARRDNDVVCVKFTAGFCKPCANIQPIYQSLSAKYPHVHMYTADVERATELSNIYKIDSMPTFLFFQNNQSIYSLKGANKDALTVAVEMADGMRAAQARATHTSR